MEFRFLGLFKSEALGDLRAPAWRIFVFCFRIPGFTDYSKASMFCF